MSKIFRFKAAVQPNPVLARMWAEGKLPLPADMQDKSKGELASLGVHKVRLSKKYARKYVDLKPRKGYDS